MPTVNVGPSSSLELQEIADTLGKSRKVIVVTGAGISTNCGIPDFRSEDGLYSMIQAQYDAALQNPPWESSNTFDIDDRPRKRAKPSYFYEVVAPDGNVVGIIDEQDTSQKISEPAPQPPPRAISSSPLSSRSTTPSIDLSDIDCGLNHLSPSSQSSSVGEGESETPEIIPCSQDDPTELEQATDATTSTIDPIPIQRTTRHFTRNIKSCVDDPSLIEASQPSTRPSSVAGSSRRQSAPSTLLSSAPTSVSSTSPVAAVHPLNRRHTLQRGESSMQSSKSDGEQVTQSSQTSRASLPNLKGRDLFDSMIWSDPFTTSIFYMFISSLRRKIQHEVTTTTETHKFLRTLRDGGRLVRNYTQNIDCLEEREGLCTKLSAGPGNRSRFHSKTLREPRPSEVNEESPHHGGVEVVLLHGSLGSLRCGICAKHTEWDHPEREAATSAGQAPDCPSCTDYNATRTGRGRRGLAVGRLRPDIVLYGEEHPHANLVGPLITHDLGLGPDVLLIMGTSLKVHGLKIMVKEFAKAVHTKGGKVVFVNRTKPPESTWGEVIDYWVEWDCDAWVIDLKERRSDIWLPQGTMEEPKRKQDASREIKSECRKPPRTSNNTRLDNDPKKAYRPSATRDCKTNGVYVTFRILDILGKFSDSEGQFATRQVYFPKPVSRVSIASNAKSEAPKKTLKRSKSMSAPKSKVTANTSKKRKSCPPVPRKELIDPKRYAAALERWLEIRKIAPCLPEEPNPDSLPLLLKNLTDSMPKPSFPFHGTSNNFGNLGGNFGWAMQKANLTTHPPSGVTLPLHHTDKPSAKKPTQPFSADYATLIPPPTNHAYGTRSSIKGPMKIETEERSSPKGVSPIQDRTIFIATTELQELGNSQNSMPTPPVSDPSDPITPDSQRIKRMGSIGAILSSPEDGSGSEVWHDASEVIST
ncbi:DHS-like NAD/FAD-binding domain-containing protein [Tricladium varicosporioides]|nr:DHS-like NAD/FAD-binding domain-containing protein [Hymenoscyphus varicosporioides]